MLPFVKYTINKIDGVEKSPIYCVAGFCQIFDIPYVWLKPWKKHYASESHGVRLPGVSLRSLTRSLTAFAYLYIKLFT